MDPDEAVRRDPPRVAEQRRDFSEVPVNEDLEFTGPVASSDSDAWRSGSTN